MKQSESIISTERLSSDSDAVFANDLDFAEIGFEDSQNDGQDDSHEKRTFICDTHVHGKRLDAALVQLVDEFSRSYLQQLIERGSATINSQVVHKAATKIKAGDTLSIVLHATPQSQAFKPEAMDIEIVYEDAHLMVINKPAGLVVHPAPGNWSGTLLNGLLHRDKGALLLPRAGIVHRLDKDTSGLMVVARTADAYTSLKAQFKDRTVDKTYHALVQGHPDPSSGTIDAPIGRHPHHDYRFAVTNDGKPSVTHYRTVEAFSYASLLEVDLETGRTHQIRVHMAATNHPCCGDLTYGADPTLASRLGLTRQWLHAVELGITHPRSDERMTFESPYPTDLAHALDVLSD